MGYSIIVWLVERWPIMSKQVVLLFCLANHIKAVSGSTSDSAIRRLGLCHFSTTPPGYQSSLITSDCGLQTSAEDELSWPHQGHFCWTGGTQRPWYVTQPPCQYASSVYILHVLNSHVIISCYWFMFSYFWWHRSNNHIFILWNDIFVILAITYRVSLVSNMQTGSSFTLEKAQ